MHKDCKIYLRIIRLNSNRERDDNRRIKMPDISMCRNEQCLAKEKCYRYMAKPSQRQAYMDFRPTDDGDECEDFIQALSVA